MELFEMLKTLSGNETLSWIQKYQCWKCFKDSKTSTDDDSHSGRPSTSKIDESIAKVTEVIFHNCLLTIHELVAEIKVSKTVCHEILRKFRHEVHRS